MSRKDITDRMVCEVYKQFHEARMQNISMPWPYEILSAMTGEPEKVCYRAIERAEKHGLIDYGVSLRSGWLSEEGEAYLKLHQTTKEKTGDE